MIDVNFKFKNRDNIVQCNGAMTIEEICNDFLTKNDLNKDIIFFVYNGIKINLEQNLFLQQLLEEKNDNEINNNDNKRRIEILVFEEFPFIIEFKYNGIATTLKVKESETIKNIFQRYSAKIKIDLNNIYFLYNGESIFYKDCENKKVSDIANSFDKNSKIISMIVIDNKNDDLLKSTNSFQKDEEIEINSDLEENLIDSKKLKVSNSKIDIKKSFYIKNIVIIFIQHIFIIIFTIFGFIFNFRDKEDIIYDKLICIITIIFLFSLFSILFLERYKKSAFMIIFLLLYPIIVMYSIFLLSKYIEYIYILCLLLFTLIEILILFFQVLIWKEYFMIKFFFISCALMDLFIYISYILLTPSFNEEALIFYFIIFTIAYFILNNNISKKFYQFDELYFSVILFNYGIILGLAYFIKLKLNFLIDYSKRRIENRQFRIFGILLGQYFIIAIFVLMSFCFEWNKSIKNNIDTCDAIIFLTNIINIVLCITGYLNFPGKTKEKEDINSNNILYIHHIIYMPMMITNYLICSRWINESYILCFIFLIFIDLFSISLYISISGKDYWIIILLICTVVNSIISLVLNYIWLDDAEKALNIFSLSLGPVIYLIVTSAFLKQFKNFNDNNYLFVLDYAFFGIIYLLLYYILCVILDIFRSILH